MCVHIAETLLLEKGVLDIGRQIADFAHSRLNKWSQVHQIHVVAVAGELERPLRIKMERAYGKTSVFGALSLSLYGAGLWPDWGVKAVPPLPCEERGTFLLGFHCPLFPHLSHCGGPSWYYSEGQDVHGPCLRWTLP